MESNINVNEVTQTQQSSFPKVQDFESTTILSDKKKKTFSRMSTATFPLALEAYFFFVFGFDSDNTKFQHVSSELLQKHTNDIDSIFKTYFKNRKNDFEQYLLHKDELNQSATNNCIKRLLASGTDGWITDEAITIFLDALNYHLGHQTTINFDSNYYIMDSINAAQFMPSFKQDKFPTADDTFTSELRDKVISKTYNHYINTLLVSNKSTKPKLIGCFNIPHIHYCMFEYNFANNTVYSRDPMDTFPLGEFDRSGFYRMILAKSFGIIQDIAQKDGKKVYCGGEDMHEKTFLKSDETFEGANSCNHKRAGDDGFPAQSDSHNCGILCLMYVAVKVLNLKHYSFDSSTFRYRLVLYIMGLKYYQAGILAKAKSKHFFLKNKKYRSFEPHERNENLSCFMNVFSMQGTKAKQTFKLITSLYNESLIVRESDIESESESEEKKPALPKDDQPPSMGKNPQRMEKMQSQSSPPGEQQPPSPSLSPPREQQPPAPSSSPPGEKQPPSPSSRTLSPIEQLHDFLESFWTRANTQTNQRVSNNIDLQLIIPNIIDRQSIMDLAQLSCYFDHKSHHVEAFIATNLHLHLMILMSILLVLIPNHLNKIQLFFCL